MMKDASKPPPLFIWKFLLRDVFVSAAVASTEKLAKNRVLAYGIAELQQEHHTDEDEENLISDLRRTLDLCDVIRLPTNMPGIVCWAKL